MGKNRKVAQNNARLFGVVSIKWVRKAKKWCKTTFNEVGKQLQEWSDDEPR
jgi:nucleotidyltransferase/DNA polymerase involved in DNA repair